MTSDEFFKIIRDLQTMERNYLNKGKQQTKEEKKEAANRQFCPTCELNTMRREDGACLMCGEKS